jgi:hypothetical protein
VEGSRKNSAALRQDDPERFRFGRLKGLTRAPSASTPGKDMTGVVFAKSIRKMLILKELEVNILKTMDFARFSRLPAVSRLRHDPLICCGQQG